MATDLENTIEYYKDLLLYQYINCDKARATTGLLVTQALVDLLPIEINAAFDVDTATGPQLDIIGEYLGFDRVVTIPIVRTYFALQDQENEGSNLTGLTTYDSSENLNTYFYSYVDSLGTVTTLNDDEYRILLKLKSYKNRSNGTTQEINDALYAIFGLNIMMVDQLDMSIAYFCTPQYSRLAQIALDEEFLPKPMGVNIFAIFEISNITKLFSFTSPYFNGFTDYSAYLSNYLILSDIAGTMHTGFGSTVDSVGTLFPVGAVSVAVEWVEIDLKKNGDVGTVTVKLFETINGLPTVELTSVSVPVSFLGASGSIGSGYRFTFPDTIYLNTNRNYAIMAAKSSEDELFTWPHAPSTGKYSNLIYGYNITGPTGITGETITGHHMGFSAKIITSSYKDQEDLSDAKFLSYEDAI